MNFQALPNNEVALDDVQQEQQTIKEQLVSHLNVGDIAVVLGTGLLFWSWHDESKFKPVSDVMPLEYNKNISAKSFHDLISAAVNSINKRNDPLRSLINKKRVAALICYAVGFWAMKKKINKKAEERLVEEIGNMSSIQIADLAKRLEEKFAISAEEAVE